MCETSSLRVTPSVVGRRSNSTSHYYLSLLIIFSLSLPYCVAPSVKKTVKDTINTYLKNVLTRLRKGQLASNPIRRATHWLVSDENIDGARVTYLYIRGPRGPSESVGKTDI